MARMPVNFQAPTPQQQQQQQQGAMQGVGIAGGVRLLQASSSNAPSPADESSPPNPKRARRSSPSADKKGNAQFMPHPQQPQQQQLQQQPIMISNQGQVNQGMRMPSNGTMPGAQVAAQPGLPVPQQVAPAPANRGRNNARAGNGPDTMGPETTAAPSRGTKRKMADDGSGANAGPGAPQKSAAQIPAPTLNGIKTSPHQGSPAISAGKDNKTPPTDKTPPLVPGGPASTPSNAQPATPKQDNNVMVLNELFSANMSQFGGGGSGSIFGPAVSSPRTLSQRISVDLPIDGPEALGGGWDQTPINVPAPSDPLFLDDNGGDDTYQMYFNFDAEEGMNFDETGEF
ncbi:hypothetical protein DACRYDRAFT_21137 [Dacryopinax primogenitus]|uniref:Uncharacterized protein n=1 Tax=Dacryopinax primogenitus (strain DJM 731) TaxID=1858805 RepID=M5GEU5_DACPD|nr:uncharacterized protein DACRYDRAFT_21137 [Dacryopinax primogenitus]EJU03603.1 hypothetical protein DACRYDRAFT_21137 [Dacryopinax primogenitus]